MSAKQRHAVRQSRRAVSAPVAARRRVLFGGAAALAAGAASAQAPAVVSGQPSLQWRLASSFPKSLDTLFGAAELFGRRVAEITDNRFQIRIFAAGEIVKGLDVLDAVQSGTVECGHTAPYYYIGKDPAFAFGTSIPFGLNARQQNAWWYQGGGREAMGELFKDYGCVEFNGGNTGAQMGGWYRKEIKAPADLHGLKMRIGGLAGQVIAKLGAVPQQIAGGEIYQALERGTIDAAEWVGPYDDEKLGFYKVAPHYYFPGWWESNSMYSFYVNIKEWEKLPKEYQAAIEAASYEANIDMMAKYDFKNLAALQRLVKNGVKLHAFSDEILRAAQKASYELYEEEAGKNPAWKKIYEPWKQFRSEEFLWHRAAEFTYEQFAYSHPLGK